MYTHRKLVILSDSETISFNSQRFIKIFYYHVYSISQFTYWSVSNRIIDANLIVVEFKNKVK